jgi:RimJ/RimL family protein N-acetyltransferase
MALLEHFVGTGPTEGGTAMFKRDGVVLRPLEPADIDTMYPWHLDYALDIYSSWGRPRSLAHFQKRWEEKLMDPPDDMITFGIETEGCLVGRLQLALIDLDNQKAMVGIVLGDRSAWGKGIAKRALIIGLDYAFTVTNLQKICAEVYGFNERSQKLFEGLGFQKEGVLRSHEVHNGARQDMHLYGILKHEFYERYHTMFHVPEMG